MSKAKQTSASASSGVSGGFSTALHRRVLFGTNVALMSVAALLIAIFANWISFRKHWRKDLALVGVYQPSDRTKRIVDQMQGTVRLTSAYTSNDPQTSREKYFPAVQDYFEELGLYAPNKIKVQHITRDREKAALVERIRQTYSGQVKAYREAVERFDRLIQEATTGAAAAPTQQPVEPVLTKALADLAAVLDADGFLALFPQIADLQGRLEKHLKELRDTRDEVQRLTQRTGLPRYDQAKQRIETAIRDLKETLTEGQKTLKQIARLAEAAGPKGDPLLTSLPQRMQRMPQLLRRLQGTVGAPQKDLPDDIKAALQAFAREAPKVATWLEGEVRQQDSLARKHPAIVTTPYWQIRMPLAANIVRVLSVTDFLEAISGDLTNLRETIRQLLRQDTPADQLASALRQLRGIVDRWVRNGDAVAKRILELRAALSRVDERSKAILTQAKQDKWLADFVAQLDALQTQLAELPEINLGELSDKLKDDNVIVVESGDKVQVLTFDDVWPQSNPLPGAALASSPKRVFNGDTAIAGALLTLTQPPVATVIFTHFAGEVPPSMRTFMGPRLGSIPYRYLDTLRKLLKQANLAVKEWNLAKEESPPEPEENTKPIYVLLPPPPNIPTPGPKQESFGAVHLDRVKKALGEGGRAIFLCKWEPPQRAMFLMPPSPPRYEYEQYLRDEWGIDVKYKYRVVHGVPETRQPGFYGVNLRRWRYMLLNNFTEHPIGKPLRARRVLMVDVCPVEQAAKVPEPIKIEPLLIVPPKDEYWADSDVLELARRIYEDQGSGLVPKDPTDKLSPFPVALAARNEKTDAAIVVLGNGGSFLDGYLGERVPRITSKGERITFDPPPTANADLLINAVLWLADRPDLIGAGPVVIPPVQPIPEGRMAAIRLLVWALLPGALLASGLAVWMVRRR